MQYLRRNSLPLLIGAVVTLFVVAIVVGVADLVRDDDADDDRSITVGALQFDLDELHSTLEGLDFENLDLDELLDSPLLAALAEALRGALGGQLGQRNSFEFLGGSGDRSPALGVTIDDSGGALVVEAVQRGTAAARAGIERGDEILSIEGRDVDTIDQLRAAVERAMSGDSFAVELRRDGRSMTLDVEPGSFVAEGAVPSFRELRERFGQASQRPQAPERDGRTPDRDGRSPERTPERTPGQSDPRQPERSTAPRLGVVAVDAPDGERVAEVRPGSGAAQAGLRPGDVIVAIEGAPAPSVAELRELLSRFAVGDFVRVTALRDGGRLQLSVMLSPPPASTGIAPGTAPGAGGRPQPGRQQQQGTLAGLLTPEAAASVATEAFLERLADLVAERLAARVAVAPEVTPAPAPPAPAPEASAPAAAELTAFFGRVAAIDDGSLRLDGTLGSVAFVLTDETVRLGFKDAALGDLVTVVVSDGVVQLLIVVG